MVLKVLLYFYISFYMNLMKVNSDESNICLDKEMEIVFLHDINIIKCYCMVEKLYFICYKQNGNANALKKVALKYKKDPNPLTESMYCLDQIQYLSPEGWECVCVKQKTLWCW